MRRGLITGALAALCLLTTAHAEPYAVVGDLVLDTEDEGPSRKKLKSMRKSARKAKRPFDEQATVDRLLAVAAYRASYYRALDSLSTPCGRSMSTPEDVAAYIAWWRERTRSFAEGPRRAELPPAGPYSPPVSIDAWPQITTDNPDAVAVATNRVDQFLRFQCLYREHPVPPFHRSGLAQFMGGDRQGVVLGFERGLPIPDPVSVPQPTGAMVENARAAHARGELRFLNERFEPLFQDILASSLERRSFVRREDPGAFFDRAYWLDAEPPVPSDETDFPPLVPED